MSRNMRIGIISLLSIGVLVGGYWAFSAYQDQRLLLAVHAGDQAMVESALFWGADVNHPESPPAIAARMCLLHLGNSGISGVSQGRPFWETLLLLLDHGADIDQPNERGYTALDYLAQSGSLHGVKELVERGADVNSRIDNRRHSPHPLVLAARARGSRQAGQFFEVITYLVEQGSDLNATCFEGHTALYYAAGQNPIVGYEPVRTLLEAGARVNPERPKFSPLHQAARYGRVANVRMLLQYGAEVDFSHRPPGQGGYTPAFATARFGEAREADAVKVLRLLIDAGANLDLELAGMPPIRESPLTQRALNMPEDEVAKLYPDRATR